MKVDLVSPERTLLSEEATMVQCRTIGGGDLAILAGHTPFIGALEIWPVRIRLADGRDEVVAVHGGFIEMSDNHVKILSNVAEIASQIDVERARRAEERAQERTRLEQDADADAALKRAHARLQAAGQLIG